MRDFLLITLASIALISGFVVLSSYHQQRQLNKHLPLSPTKNQLILLKQALIPLTLSFAFVLFINSSFLLPQAQPFNLGDDLIDKASIESSESESTFDARLNIEVLDQSQIESAVLVVDYGFVKLKDDDRLYRYFEIEGQKYLIDEGFTTFIKITDAND